ncbi:MAG: hypothetical protein QM820_43910 [Minicystis sp.]
MALACGGCAALTEDTHDGTGEVAGAQRAGNADEEVCPQGNPGSVDSSTEPPRACFEAEERVGEAVSESALNTGCRAACAVAYALGCVSVGLACSGATTITLGGATIPCAWALIAACGVIAPGGTQVCMSFCPS